MATPKNLSMIALAALTLGACLTAAATTPWMLGDETTTACYTLDTLEDIPLPAGLDMQWVLPLPGALDSAAPYLAEYTVTVDDAVFWDDAANVARLGADHAHWRQLCNGSATANNTGCSDANKAACCVFHSNLHSCRQSTGSACEPWVTPRNATAVDTSAACGTNASTTAAPAATAEPTVLVTHTAAQVGAVGPYVQRLQLPAGSWVTIAHVKIMNFQCAVGALRRSVEPEPESEASSRQVVAIAAGVSVAAVVIPMLIAAAYVLWQRHQQAAAIARCPTDETQPFTASFIGVKNEAELRENYEEAAVRGAFRRLAEIVSCAARASECHEAREVNEATVLLVAKHPLQALDFAARAVEVAVLNEDWSAYFNAATLQKVHARKVADDESDAQSVSSLGTAKSAADPSATTASIASGGTGTVAEVEHPVVAVNVGVAFGFGSIAQNRDTEAISYHGDVVDRAAVAADIADAGEIVVSAALVDSLSEEGAEPDGRFAPLSVANHEGDLERHTLFVPTALDLGGGAKTAIVPSVNTNAKYNKGRTPRSSRTNKRGRGSLRKGSSSPSSGGGISAALTRAELGVSRRRCAVVIIDVAALVPPAVVNARTARKLQTAHAKLVANVAERSVKVADSCRCTIVNVTGSRITAVVNVVGDALASNPLTRACHFALLLQSDLAEVITEARDAETEEQPGGSPGSAAPLSPGGREGRAPATGRRSATGGITIGVATGEAACGEIGGLVAVVGSVADRAVVAQAAAAALAIPVLVASPLTQAIEDPALAHFVSAAVDVAAVAKGFESAASAPNPPPTGVSPKAAAKAAQQPHVPTASPPLISTSDASMSTPRAMPAANAPTRALQVAQLVAVVSERPAVDSEWMYTMRDAAHDHDGAWAALLVASTTNGVLTPVASASASSPTAAGGKSVTSVQQFANMSWSTMPPASPTPGAAGSTSPTSDSLGASLPTLNASSLAESVAIKKLTELRALNREHLALAAAAPSLMQYAASRTLHFTCPRDLVAAAAAAVDGNADFEAPTLPEPMSPAA